MAKKSDMATQFEELIQQETTAAQALNHAYQAARRGNADKTKELFRIAQSLGVVVPESVNFDRQQLPKSPPDDQNIPVTKNWCFKASASPLPLPASAY